MPFLKYIFANSPYNVNIFLPAPALQTMQSVW